ncbi:hypothetical protein BH23BAC3_BH23BAC3_24360 [soil metagenome]
MQTVNKRHIEDRLTDWKKRIADLYNQIDIWLSNESQYSFERSSPITLEKEMIDKFGVGRVQLPTANIYRKNNLVASLKPKGLWVIGANVRVDLISKSKLIMLLDLSEQVQDSNWNIVSSKSSQKKLPLNKSNLINILHSL